MAIKGFEKVTKTKRKNLIISVEGMEKTGKTTFGLTAPEPIALFDMDIGTDRALNKVIPGKNVWSFCTNYRLSNDPDEWKELWSKLRKSWYDALSASQKDCGSVVADTFTEVYELIRLAHFGKLSNVLPHHYGPVNAELRDMINISKDSGKNVILIHKVKDEYINDKTTGKKKRAGFAEVGYLADINIVTSWKADTGFVFTIRDCGQNMDLAGMELVGDMINFDTIAEMVNTD